MIYSKSGFTASTIPVLHNAVKSIIFKCAELLMAFFIYKVFSFFAARSNQFTSYLMFAEDYIQRLLFLTNRGLSRAGLIVFSILNLLASLYGTLLWALDSPGYLFRASNATVDQYATFRNENPPYVIQLQLDPNTLQKAEEDLAHVASSGLFNPGLNGTLTGEVDRGIREIVPPSATRKRNAGARIWLDDEGFSVSTDQYFMLPISSDNTSTKVFNICINWGSSYVSWNCTFNSVFGLGYIQGIVGNPEIHWDDQSDKMDDSRYISPNRINNIWASYGMGGGSAAMMQIFTVTKGTRRHTFVETTMRATMISDPGVPFDDKEVEDLVRRTWSPTNETARDHPMVGQIVQDMMGAQDQNMSYFSGASVSDNDNFSVLQSSWGLFEARNSANSSIEVYTLIGITSTNITLIRSETIDEEPTPFEDCGFGSWQNEAFGGKVTRTDCVGSRKTYDNNRFFGQTDTAAVLIAFGLGKGRSNRSSESLNDAVFTWVAKAAPVMEDLLVARGFVVSVDPALVQISVQKLIAAVSPLQVFLSLLALVLAVISWLGVTFFTDAPWSSTLLANLVHTAPFTGSRPSKAGYMRRPPNVEIVGKGEGCVLTVSGRAVVPQETQLAPPPLMQPDVYPAVPIGHVHPTMMNPHDNKGSYQYITPAPGTY